MEHLTSLSTVCDTSSSYRDCDTGLKGKIKRTGFTDSVSRTSAMLDLVHSDSDNGGEYIGNEFEKHLRDKGILHRKTVPYNPQQNGKAEGLNQTLMNLTRADECIFLGFQEGLEGYRLWRLNDKRIIVSRDVRFYEHVFPFKTPCPAKPLVHEQENVVEMPDVEERNEH
ncbi:hypothetical protein PR048_000251 [Dryococelus australis]|uniref:Integrase catalytic domain-containing protein n=1 Tax=Dryococelus australis TaxID=614101 RepID=A0ABQ9IE60_9NEOP|nr:hypothetical protein PR048_000251 [Dryococelus australis]